MNVLVQSPLYAGLFMLACLTAAALFGGFVRSKIAEHHRSRETVEIIQASVTMLVTFAAIVLGLMVSSSNSNFNDASQEVDNFAIQLIELDRDLRLVGPTALPIRQQLRSYTAAAIAETWTDEPPPRGDYPKAPPENPNDINIASTQLGHMLDAIGTDINNLQQDDVLQRERRAAANRQFEILDKNRWYLLSVEDPSVGLPYLMTLALWMAIVFACFGLVAPQNPIALIIIFLAGAAVASAVYVVVDLNTFFDDGFFSIPSTNMRQALRAMEMP